VAKKKLARFKEMVHLGNVVQPTADEVLNKKYRLSGKWAKEFFGSEGPVILELGCGKGEYTVGLAMMFPERNFLGVDIKGARMWKGARFAHERGIRNAGFLRTRIELINSFFDRGEIDNIWLTFPDPQLKKARKRLTSPGFLNRYRQFLRSNGAVHLKTDSRELYDYTLSVIRTNRLPLEDATEDLYGRGGRDEILAIKTYYEQQFLEQGKPILYTRFRLDGALEISEPDDM
jgi:tRNA (guanine-N7-)-methyltransferase